ncbi:MAG: FAD-dependent thymidylate synthase, partial [Candidatus Heimdallarchaeaceae archaeon]
MINVTLLSYTQGNSPALSDPELVTATIKRVCTTNRNFEDLIDPNLKDWRNIKTIKDGHLGVLEHISFTFLVEGISRIVTHQIVRHRLASYLQMSQRTVPIDQLDIVVPKTIENSPFA